MTFWETQRRLALSVIRGHLRAYAKARRNGQSGAVEFGQYLGARATAAKLGFITFDDFTNLMKRSQRVVFCKLSRANSCPTTAHSIH